MIFVFMHGRRWEKCLNNMAFRLMLVPADRDFETCRAVANSKLFDLGNLQTFKYNRSWGKHASIGSLHLVLKILTCFSLQCEWYIKNCERILLMQKAPFTCLAGQLIYRIAVTRRSLDIRAWEMYEALYIEKRSSRCVSISLHISCSCLNRMVVN